MAKAESMTENLACFGWHPAARIAGEGQGDAVFAPALAARPAAAALRSALAGQGAAFRIGGKGPVGQGHGMFETLTGGSLGQPRRIWRSQQSWLASFAVNARLFGLGPGVSVAVLGDLSHSLALYGAVEALNLGCDLHLLDEMRPDRQLAAIAARRVALIYATPTQLRFLAEAGGGALPDLRQIIVGGAKVEPGLRAVLAGLAPGARVSEFYGAAETSFITLATAQSGPETVGHAYPGVQIAIRDPAGIAVPDGQQGEVWVQSPYLFAGYAGDDPGLARWSAGWLSVGEIGVMTGQGLVLRGRAGRMVTVADRNVFPEEIEAWLATLPGVTAAAVLPRDDALRGRVLVAVLQGDAAQEPQILAQARAHLGPLVAPRAILWRPDWPRLASGKTDLASLAAQVAQVAQWR